MQSPYATSNITYIVFCTVSKVSQITGQILAIEGEVHLCNALVLGEHLN